MFAVLLLLGIMSFRTLPVTRFPNIDIPIISVTVTQSGAAPAELESQITKQVEDGDLIIALERGEEVVAARRERD